MTIPSARPLCFYLYASLLPVPGEALAQSDPPREIGADAEILNDDLTHDGIHSYGVRARRSPDVGSAVTIIDAGMIEARQYSFVADALKEAPGVAVARNGAAGGFASARIRGSSSGQTLVVIDGFVVNDPAAPQGGFNLANLDVADVAQIEVLRGPQSLIWGADAIGGVILIRTKDKGDAVSAYAEGGSFGTARAGATFFGEVGGAFARATLSGVRSDGISRAAAGAERDAHRSLAASITAGAGLAPSADLRLSARISDSQAEIDGFPPPAFTLADTAETEDTKEYAVAARLDHRAGGYDGAFSIAYNRVDRENEDGGFPTFAAEGARLSAGYRAALALARGVDLEGGLEGERQSAKVSGVDESATSGALFALIEARPLKGVVVSAGARRDEFSNFAGATTTRFAGVWSLHESEVGGGGAARLRASWGEGFRAPTLFELNFDQFGVIPNPDLRPERARGFDIGFEYEAGSWDADRALARLRATYFHQRVRDQIDFDFAGSGFFNIDRVKSDGVEVEIDWSPAAFLGTRLVYALIDARNAATGARLARTPKHSGSGTLIVSPTDALRLSATLTLNGREADSPTPNRSFAKVDVRASYAASDALEFYGRVENATDADYQDVSGYGEPGVSAFAGVRVRL